MPILMPKTQKRATSSNLSLHPNNFETVRKVLTTGIDDLIVSVSGSCFLIVKESLFEPFVFLLLNAQRFASAEKCARSGHFVRLHALVMRQLEIIIIIYIQIINFRLPQYY